MTTRDATTGAGLARGVARWLVQAGFAPVPEHVPDRGLRVDLMALGPRDEVWVIECKSGPADFRADRKWHRYLPWCDRFFWAVDPAFPRALLPDQTGIILADSYDAALLRDAPARLLAPARRRRVVRDLARGAALRLHRQQHAAPGAG